MNVLIYIGAGIIILWGIAHLIPTRQIVKGFGEISADNKKVLAMEIITEGLTLIFLGVLPILATALGDSQSTTAYIVYIASAVMLLVMAVITQLTGARTPIIWYKVCPAVKTAAAILYILGTVL
jgi:VIT1/CCC1 family predicted Fe2+/Mn2+ transporter